MKKTIVVSLFMMICFCGLFAQQPAAPPAQPTPAVQPQGPSSPALNPVNAEIRAEIAKTRRDILLADSQKSQAVEVFKAANERLPGLHKTLDEKMAEANKACPKGKAFSEDSLECVAPPPNSEQAK